MPRSRVLAIIQAGGAGSRMDVLTRERAKPALPFAGVFQLVDFPLSNLANSGVNHIWLSVQFRASSMEEQVANGRPWDLDRNHEGLRLLMPEQGTGSLDEDGFATGNADELYRIRDRVQAARPDVLLVLSADHVYRADLDDVVRAHLDAGAECTVVTTEVPVEQASDHAVVRVEDGRVVDFAYKPEDPASGVVATEIFAYDPAVLVEVLEELHRELGADAGPGDSGLGDFGEHLLPRLVARGRTAAFALPGYWRDLGTPSKFLAAHRDVLLDDVGVLGVEDWPIITHQPQRPPARFLDGAVLSDSLVSPGCTVAGTVRSSVLSPGVVVEAGAEVVDSVLFADTVVRAGASVHRSIVDMRCDIGADAVVGGPDADLDDDDAITVVGRGSTVGTGVHVGVGSRLEPGTSA
ncbi:glucose-1-phosphate adenylyltransferase [Nocardioides dongxiaopingii]|uniref:glucose-1-phosphate adenylyltransferase family protein n=1 Tax=Nocardioides sp. S-1144 TaxID=2582905 RepID=UPI00110DDC96|nr:sugar phosphate nucleotidyltransferase [Nocardioides sp. S-1144]QCW51977.1 glucose-1-phosphate adenylyltransferase [Nocardioides sp. S-1144]